MTDDESEMTSPGDFFSERRSSAQMRIPPVWSQQRQSATLGGDGGNGGSGGTLGEGRRPSSLDTPSLQTQAPLPLGPHTSAPSRQAPVLSSSVLRVEEAVESLPAAFSTAVHGFHIQKTTSSTHQVRSLTPSSLLCPGICL